MEPGNLDLLPQSQGFSSTPFGSSWSTPCLSHARGCSLKLSPPVTKEARVSCGGQEDSAWAEESEWERKHAHIWEALL